MTARTDLEARYFGRGPRLQKITPDGQGLDITFVDGPQGRDLATASGTPNLAQDLMIALLTPTGSDPFNVLFGFDGLRVLSDSLTPSMTTEMLRLAVLKTVALDSRIRRVLDLHIVETEPGSRRYRVDAEIQTVIGDVLHLVLGDVEGE